MKRVSAVAALLSTLVPLAVWGQNVRILGPDDRHLQVGVALTGIRASQPGDILGFGGHASYDLNRLVSVDADVFHAPGIGGDGPFGETVGLFGAKAGYRTESIGLFLKARSGFVHCGAGSGDCRYRFPAQNTFFALDLGGVAEVYARRTYLRMDFGDTIVAYGAATVGGYPDRPLGTRHHKSFALGFGVRF